MSFGPAIEATVGANVDGLRRAGPEVETAAGSLAGSIAKKFEMKDVGRTLATALGINLESIAQNVARFVIGFSKDQEEALDNLVKKTDEVADEQVRILKEARARAAKEADAATEREIAQMKLVNDTHWEAYQARREAAQKAAEAAVEAAKKEGEVRRDLNAELSRLDNEAAEAKMTSTERLLDLRRQEKVATKEIAELTALGSQRSNDQTQTLIDLRKQLPSIQAEIKTITDATTASETELAGAVEKTNDALDARGGIAKAVAEEIHDGTAALKSFVAEWTGWKGEITTTGRGNKDLSNRELDRKIKNIEDDLFNRQVRSAMTGTPDFFSNPQRFSLQSAVAERQLRDQVTRAVATYGEERAFGMFNLDENRWANILRSSQDTSEGTQLLRKIEQGQRRGFEKLAETLKHS